MRVNQNEEYLLRFISCANQDSSKKDDLVSIICKLGIEPQFKNYNPVYQIIDKLNFI